MPPARARPAPAGRASQPGCVLRSSLDRRASFPRGRCHGSRPALHRRSASRSPLFALSHGRRFVSTDRIRGRDGAESPLKVIRASVPSFGGPGRPVPILAPGGRAARVPRAVPDPRGDDVPHQPLAGRDARRRRGARARVRAHLEDARRARLGRGLVGPAARGRRPDRPPDRRAARLGLDAPERDDRRGGGRLVLRLRRAAPADRLRGGQLPVGALPLPGPAAARTSSSPPTRRAWSRRSTSGRCSSRSRTSLYKTGEIQDVEAIVARAHEEGALVVLDAYQSVGTVPLDVTALGVDFAVGGSVKWLCGGPGRGWLYVRPDLAATLEPALTGWQAHARPFAFEPEQDYADGLGALPDRHAERAGALRRDRRLRRGRGGRRRADPRALAGSRRRCSSSCSTKRGSRPAGRSEPDRRGGTVVVQVPGLEARQPRARRARRDLRLAPGRRPAPRAALLQHRRRAPLRGRADRRARRSDGELAPVEALGQAARRSRLHPAQPQQREEEVFREPLLRPLRAEALEQCLDLAPRDRLLEVDEDVGRAEVAVVLGDLVLEDQVVAEGVPGQLGDEPVVLVAVVVGVREDEVGLDRS